jgi:hypothetical protein
MGFEGEGVGSVTKDSLGPAGVVVVTLLVISYFVGGPIAIIWAIKVLFGFEIALSVKTWFAAMLLLSFAGGPSVRGRE